MADGLYIYILCNVYIIYIKYNVTLMCNVIMIIINVIIMIMVINDNH